MVTTEELRELIRNGADPLELSIKKWEKIVAGEEVDRGAINCALCVAHNDYYGKANFKECGDCPVFKKTGKTACDDTPYEEWSSNGFIRVNSDNSKKARSLARKELKFLKSLVILSTSKKEGEQ